MLDEIDREISSRVGTEASPLQRDAVEKKLTEIRHVVMQLIGMKKTAAIMGTSYHDLLRGLWEEASEEERSVWKQKHPNLIDSELFESFVREMLKKSK